MKKFVALLLSLCLGIMSGTVTAETETAFDNQSGAIMEFHQIDVGMANAILIRQGDLDIMIDGGLNDLKTRAMILQYLESAGVETLDIYIATHWHGDHAGNMNAILERFGTDQTLVYGPSEQIEAQWLPLATGEYAQMVNGDRLSLGNIEILCVGPWTLECNGCVNKDSLNLLFTYGSRRFLVTGDYMYSREVTDQWLDQLKEVDVYQYPHHGIKDCVDPWAVMLLDPGYITVPGCRPNKLIMSYRRRYYNPEWLSTGVYQNIVFLTDGESLEVETHYDPNAAEHI